MKQELFAVRVFIDNIDNKRIATIRARTLDAAVYVQRGEDAESIPSAVRKPPSPGGVHPIGGRDGRERVGHADLIDSILKDQGVAFMKSTPTCCHLGWLPARSQGYIFDGRRPSQFDEQTIGAVAKSEIGVIHGAIFAACPTLRREKRPAQAWRSGSARDDARIGREAAETELEAETAYSMVDVETWIGPLPR